MLKCVNCKSFKKYDGLMGGVCNHTLIPTNARDIEYPNSYSCFLYSESRKLGKRGRPKKKVSLIERIIKWITKGKY
jgi:hypothetical protein